MLYFNRKPCKLTILPLHPHLFSLGSRPCLGGARLSKLSRASFVLWGGVSGPCGRSGRPRLPVGPPAGAVLPRRRHVRARPRSERRHARADLKVPSAALPDLTSADACRLPEVNRLARLPVSAGTWEWTAQAKLPVFPDKCALMRQLQHPYIRPDQIIQAILDKRVKK